MIDTKLKNVPYRESPYIYFNENPPLKFLTDNFETLKKEFQRLATWYRLADINGNLHLDPGNIGMNKTNQHGTMYKGLYKSIQLFMRNTLLDSIEKKNGNWKPDELVRIKTELIELAPKHFEFIDLFKDIIGAVNYNISYPGARLRYHYGLNKDYIRLHMCIIESKGCVFDIEGWKHEWKEGEIFGFDDYYTYHGTNHDRESINPRSILMIDMTKTYLEQYSKTWPIRDSRRIDPSAIKKIINFKDWE